MKNLTNRITCKSVFKTKDYFQKKKFCNILTTFLIFSMTFNFLQIFHDFPRKYTFPGFSMTVGTLHKKAEAFVYYLLWLPEKGSHIVFTWPFLHFLTLPAAVAAKLLFQFKSDLEFKCVSHLGLHLGRPNFSRQPPTF